MNHIDEERLLEYALEVCSDESDHTDIERHLGDCSQCRDRLKVIKEDIEIIGGVRPSQAVLSLPGTKARNSMVYPLLRAAALIIFGIFVGFGAASWINQKPAFVSPAYVTLTPPDLTLEASAVSDATEIPQSYYDGMLNSVE